MKKYICNTCGRVVYTNSQPQCCVFCEDSIMLEQQICLYDFFKFVINEIKFLETLLKDNENKMGG